MALEAQHLADLGPRYLQQRWHPALLQQDEQLQPLRTQGPSPGTAWPGRIVGVQRQRDMPSSSTASADLHSSGQAHSADMGSNSAGSCLMAATEQLRLFGPLGPDSRFSPPAMLPQPLPQAMHPALMPPDHHDMGLMQQFASCSFGG